MSNLETFKKLSTPPSWAKREIQNGTLKGKTDISPMWRFEVMTEVFGICGIGWKYEIIKQWEYVCPDHSVMVFTNVLVYICKNGTWSEGIPGTGGSKLISRFGTAGGTKEGYLDPSDEGYKMSLTDALSVAFKALGVGASVYSGASDDSKYLSYLSAKVDKKPEATK